MDLMPEPATPAAEELIRRTASERNATLGAAIALLNPGGAGSLLVWDYPGGRTADGLWRLSLEPSPFGARPSTRTGSDNHSRGALLGLMIAIVIILACGASNRAERLAIPLCGGRAWEMTCDAGHCPRCRSGDTHAAHD